jgi:hypothetical protein
VDLGARVIYCMPRVALDGTIVYLTGFELLDQAGRDNRAAADEILDDLAFRLSIKAG